MAEFWLLANSGVLLAEAQTLNPLADASGKHTQIQIRPDADGTCNSRRDVEGLVGPLVDSGVLLVEALPEHGADARNVDGREDMIQFVRQVRRIDEQLWSGGTMHDPTAMSHRLMLMPQPLRVSRAATPIIHTGICGNGSQTLESV